MGYLFNKPGGDFYNSTPIKKTPKKKVRRPPQPFFLVPGGELSPLGDHLFFYSAPRGGGNWNNSWVKKGVRAVFGSLFLLLSILVMSSIMGTTDFDALYKTNFNYSTELFLFLGIFIAFAIKTPTIFLNS